MARHRSIAAFAAVTLMAAALCYALKGTNAVSAAVDQATWDVFGILPYLTLGIVMAGFVVVLIPRERVAAMIGRESGLRGLLVASAIGALMPGGPFASFPLVLALSKAGADVGALIAFLVAWAAIGVQRMIMWEIPFMGWEFGVVRFLSSLPLSVLAGMMARALSDRFAFFRLRDP